MYTLHVFGAGYCANACLWGFASGNNNAGWMRVIGTLVNIFCALNNRGES